MLHLTNPLSNVNPPDDVLQYPLPLACLDHIPHSSEVLASPAGLVGLEALAYWVGSAVLAGLVGLACLVVGVGLAERAGVED